MFVTVATVITYDDRNNAQPEESVAIGARRDLADLVATMHPFSRPTLLLEGTRPDGRWAQMSVLGGSGEYLMSVEEDGHRQIAPIYPDKLGKEIEIWQSDQGFSVDSSRVTASREEAAAIAWAWCETGALLDSVNWQPLT